MILEKQGRRPGILLGSMLDSRLSGLAWNPWLGTFYCVHKQDTLSSQNLMFITVIKQMVIHLAGFFISSVTKFKLFLCNEYKITEEF